MPRGAEPAVQTGEAYKVKATQKRVRARLGGMFVADTKEARIVAWGGYPKTYAIPRDDFRSGVLSEEGSGRNDERFGRLRLGTLRVDGKTVKKAARIHEEGPLAGLVSLEWEKMDGWYEESEEVWVHPRDPEHRIDVLQSERHVVVEVDGVGVAESRRPMMLFETGLPPRYYLPPTDVRLEFLVPSDKTTRCPYKGLATYHHVEIAGKRHKDLVWSYRRPLLEALKVQGLLCFFDERTDVTVDGEPQERPDTPWRE